jgi:hypothetical protein
MFSTTDVSISSLMVLILFSAAATAAVKSKSQPVFYYVAHMLCGFPKVCQTSALIGP